MPDYGSQITQIMPDPNMDMANALQRYPNSGDVAFARQQDWSYGQPWANYFQGQRFSALNGSPLYEPLPKKNIDLSLETAPWVSDYYGKGALAASRSALATLGFDPTRTAADLDTSEKGLNTNIGRLLGEYHPKTDEIWSVARRPESLVHESIHRGLQKLYESPYWKEGMINPKSNANELMVRLLMNEKMGEIPQTDFSRKMRDQAQDYFNPNLNQVIDSGPEKGLIGMGPNRKAFDATEAAAAKYIASKNPRGHH